MKTRHYWVEHIEALWDRKSVVWVSGVRRAGKTFLCRSLKDTEYFDCELPGTRREMEDPESFLKGMSGKRIILDEIHRLNHPAELLKIAADHYPSVKIVATGSSTLGASAKFRDTLAGRKAELWLTPMIARDLADFGNTDIKHRLLRGGLPPFFMAAKLPERDFQEWMDAYWARDIQDLFRLERRHSFQRFAELLFVQSGGMFESTRFSGPCEVSRTTIASYLSVLDATFVVQIVRPFSSRRANEIVSAPKVYGFDTGFVSYHKGWSSLRPEDMGLLWEHYVLNELQARLQCRDVLYWRDKQGHEIDFIVRKRGQDPTTVECKWNADRFEPTSLTSFRRHHPSGANFVVAPDIPRPFVRRYDNVDITFLGLEDLMATLTAEPIAAFMA